MAEALAVTSFDDPAPAKLSPKRRSVSAGELSVLVDVPAYRCEKLRLDRTAAWRVDPTSFQVLYILRGALGLRSGNTEVDLGHGQVAVVPAAAGFVEARPGDELCEIVISGLGGKGLAAIE